MVDKDISAPLRSIHPSVSRSVQDVKSQPASGMYGVLVDVSGSMREAYALDRSQRVNVERTHAILTTIVNIVHREVVHHQRHDFIFAGAFGLEKSSNTCDLLYLLDCVNPKIDGHSELSRLASQHGASRAELWIRKHLTQREARILYKVLSVERGSIDKLIALIPPSDTLNNMRTYETIRSNPLFQLMGVSYLTSNYSEESLVKDHEAYKFAQEIIDGITNHSPEPRPVKEVSDMLNEVLPSAKKETCPPADSSLHDEIEELIDPIKPYIFGGTPMRKALDTAMGNFRGASQQHKVLFLLSDGDSGDGDPRLIAEQLCRKGVTIVTCFLTSDNIQNPRILLDSSSGLQCGGRRVLFEISSTMKNTHTPISYLVDAGWELPLSGESHLFIQANSLDVVNEFCKIVVSQLGETCDALVSLLHKVPLATYINQTNADFEPKEQEGGTCYANAIAAVFHLAMHRIVGRKGGIPTFEVIRDRIIREYGRAGANTKTVLARVCQEYRLHYREVDEAGARKAINERRPVVARFSWYGDQARKFKEYFGKEPRGILRRSDMQTGDPNRTGGHAVVLIRCDPSCLTIMNSWGQDWGDGGFFRVKDGTVLSKTEFFDVYWNEEDLLPEEVEAYKKECSERARNLLHTFPSVQDLSHTCPKCNKSSRIAEFYGHVLEAECPRCHEKFMPTNEDILQSLYSRNFD